MKAKGSLTVLLLLMSHGYAEMTNHVAEMVFPLSGTAIVLRLDASGHALKDYDSFLRYPPEYQYRHASFEDDHWDERAIGTYADIRVTRTNGHLSVTVDLHETLLTGWRLTAAVYPEFRTPTFAAISSSTTNLPVHTKT